MTKIIGLTGGIGSGKTTVSRVFEILGIPVFNSDDCAKRYYNQNRSDLEHLALAFGNEIFVNDKVDTQKLAAIVFNDTTALQKLNAIIHPWVKNQFLEWLKNQNTSVVIREAAILIESGSHRDCSSIIHVTAPAELRIERAMKRNQWSRTEVIARMDKQWNDEQRLSYCQFEIINDDRHLVLPQIESVYRAILD